MTGATRRYSRLIPLIFFMADLSSFNLSFFLASYTRFNKFFLFEEGYFVLQLILNFLWFSIFFYSRLYEPRRELNLTEQLNRVFTGLLLNLFFVFSLWFAFKPYEYSRGLLFFLYLYFALYVVVWRTTWYYAIRYYRSKGYNLRRVVIAGYNSTTQDLWDYFSVNRGIGYECLGFFDDQQSDSRVVGKLDMKKIQDYAVAEEVDVMFLYTPYFSRQEVRELVHFAENHLIKVKLISHISSLGYANIAISNYGSIPALNVTALPLDQLSNRIVKRLFDLVFSSLVVIFILSWMIPLIGLLIKLDSRGPVFFRQDRNGKDNKEFKIYKFRTMRLHMDQRVEQAHKGDHRVTKLGLFLRKSSLDEFPQFINVLIGDMSVIGPRPHAIPHNEDFRRQVDRFMQRHAVKPGITGLAQCRGFRGETNTFHALNGRIRLDRFYVRNWSFLFDIKIIFMTVSALIGNNENAY